MATLWVDGYFVEELDCTVDDCLYRDGQLELPAGMAPPVEVVGIVADSAGASRAAKVETDRCR